MTNKERQIAYIDALNNDKQLQLLYAELTSLSIWAIPKVLLINGKRKVHWIDGTNNPRVQELKLLIDIRISEILSFYNR